MDLNKYSARYGIMAEAMHIVTLLEIDAEVMEQAYPERAAAMRARLQLLRKVLEERNR